jgi:hypothetical protein
MLVPWGRGVCVCVCVCVCEDLHCLKVIKSTFLRFKCLLTDQRLVTHLNNNYYYYYYYYYHCFIVDESLGHREQHLQLSISLATNQARSPVHTLPFCAPLRTEDPSYCPGKNPKPRRPEVRLSADRQLSDPLPLSLICSWAHL